MSDVAGPSRRGSPRQDFAAAVIFYFVCLLLSPAIAVGYVLWAGNALARRKSGVSATPDSTPPSRQRLAELLRGCGLSLVEHRAVGQENERTHAVGGFAVAIVN